MTLFGLSVYLQIFSTGRIGSAGSWASPSSIAELAFAKLLQCLRALLPSAGMEAVVTFVPVCLLLGLGPGSILDCVFSRLTYALLFQSGDLLVERFWSGANKTLLMVLYLVILLPPDAAGRDRGHAALWLFPPAGRRCRRTDRRRNRQSACGIASALFSAKHAGGYGIHPMNPKPNGGNFYGTDL